MDRAIDPLAGRLTIGRFALLTDLSARTLRKYDRLGLLCPASVDPDTRYRSYAFSQVPRAETIRLLRSLDVPLSEIARILDNDDPAATRHLLENQFARIEQRIARFQHTLMRLESALARGGTLGAYECELRDVPPIPVLALHFATPRGAIDEIIISGRARLLEFAAANRLEIAGREIIVYDFDPTERRDYEGDVCLPLTREVAGEGAMRGRVLPACTVAVTRHRGPDEDLRAAYCSLAGWIVDQGLQIVGHERETYLRDERDSPDPRDHVTEIMWPVEPTTDVGAHGA
jgi:DNA-binding transcriptional MerR regulator